MRASRHHRWIDRARSLWAIALTRPGRPNRWVMIGLTVVTALIAIISAVSLDVSLESFNWAAILGAMVISLTSAPLVAWEYRLSLRLAGYDTDSRTSLLVSIYGTVANILPLPGGFAVKLKAMTEGGVTVRRAAGSQLLAGLIWLGLSALALSIALPDARLPVLALAAALGLVALGLHLSARFAHRPAVILIGVETLFLVSSALRFYLILVGLGLSATLSQTIGLAASGPLASAIGLVPGALGLFEGITAGISVLVGLSAGAGFLAAAFLRVLTYVALLPWIPWVGRHPGRIAE